jgi:putative molybdopterin biosynthesis protein
MDDNSALTPQEVADILKIAKNTVYALIKRGELNSYRVGKKVRVDISDVDEYKNRTKSIKSNPQAGPVQDTIRANPLSQEEPPRSGGFVICGQDILLDILSRYLQLHPNGVQALRSYVGSYNGLYALYQGKVQMATAHLWDGDTGQYNVPYVRRMLPGVPAVIIHLACRLQGFYVPKGNPRGIKGWEDLKRKDITIINREKGSGTRVLLDEHLRRLGISSGSIKGYDRESTSHLAIASTVARGGADIGIGNEKSGLQVKGIDFIPLQTERYELVIRKEDMDKAPFKAAVEILRSPEFLMELEGIGGYDLAETGRIVAET